MECLVTKLTESVNNDNLPIFESMQQFTLDAITASEKTMTDAQKLSLNHFFYEIGAIEGSELWNKIDILFLPSIAGNLGKALYDYKASLLRIDMSESTNFSIENGGLDNITSSNINLELNNLTQISARSEKCGMLSMVAKGKYLQTSTSYNIKFEVTRGTVKTDMGFPYSGAYQQGQFNNGQVTTCRGSNIPDDTVIGMMCSNSYYDSSNHVVGKYFDGNGNLGVLSNRTPSGTYVDDLNANLTMVRFGISANGVWAAAILFNDALTENEMAKVAKACAELRLAF